MKLTLNLSAIKSRDLHLDDCKNTQKTFNIPNPSVQTNGLLDGLQAYGRETKTPIDFTYEMGLRIFIQSWTSIRVLEKNLY